MFEDNITTLINNKMAIGDWQRIYDFAIENEDFGLGKGKNYVSNFFELHLMNAMKFTNM